MKNIQSILVGTDLTAASDHVVRSAAAVAALTGASLHVLHAFDFDATPYLGGSAQPLTFHTKIADAKRTLDEQIARSVGPSTTVASREVIIYIAFKAIQERAQLVNADLIVLGRHCRNTLGDAFLGGTADRVIRSVDVPCLIIRDPISLPLRRVVVPIDLSSPALGALDVALEWSVSLAPADGAPELIVLHVIPQVFNSADVPLDRRAIGSNVMRRIEAARARHTDLPSINVRQEVRWADAPADEIVRFAEDEKADMAVLGTHGRGAFKRALIGSVAAGVARSAGCPVLLVPPTMWAAAAAD